MSFSEWYAIFFFYWTSEFIWICRTFKSTTHMGLGSLSASLNLDMISTEIKPQICISQTANNLKECSTMEMTSSLNGKALDVPWTSLPAAASGGG